ncbi:MAG: tail tape measure protein [Sphingopyxis sp.]|nr:tail tape measure protein [Sphingopyxis sp.]
MGDDVDEMVVAVRADTGAFRRDVAALRAELGGPLVAGAEDAGRAIERALSRAIVSGKLGFEDLKRLATTVMADIARAAISNGIGAAIGTGGSSGGGGGGGLLSLATSVAMALFGAPGRATGGPVSAGRAYRVGERGPELFVPTASGRIEAAGSGTGARNIAITVNVRGEAGGEPQRLAQTGRQLACAVRRAVASGED